MEQVAFLDLGFVARCIHHLRSQKIHRHFAGYLCLCFTATREGRERNLKPAFKAFFDRFLLVGDAPEATPYVVPFNESGSSDANVWLNGNVAGSYAVSSLRPQAPLRRVAELFGTGKSATFSLVEEHESACLEHLLFGHPVNAVALSGFLFRDHSFILTNGQTPTITDLVRELYVLLGFNDGRFSKSIFVEDEEFDFGQIWAPPQPAS
ncbi:MAG: hypothetical protein H6R04_1864 [Burkholderiaceae bacterium]|nr:hypothetical protein [Burkholderiaceae bacterium]